MLDFEPSMFLCMWDCRFLMMWLRGFGEHVWDGVRYMYVRSVCYVAFKDTFIC